MRKILKENQSLHEVLLGNRIMPERMVLYRRVVPRETNANKQKVETRVVVGSILLSTEKLLGAHPSDKSTILIVKADTNSGYQGLIINKPISWDSMSKLEKGSEILKGAPLSFGGPLIQQGFPLVALTREADEDKHPEVLPGTFFLNQSATIKEIDELKSGTGRLPFTGFSLALQAGIGDSFLTRKQNEHGQSARREFQRPAT